MYGVWVYSSSPVRVEFYVRFLHRLVEGFKRTLLGLLSPTMKSVMQTPPRHTRRLEQDALLFLDPCSEGAWRCKVEDEMHTKGHAITQFWCVPSMQRLDVCNTLCKWSFGVRLVAAEWLRGSLNEWMNELDTSSEEHHVCPANFKAICESDQTGFSVERNTISPKGPFSSSTRGFLSYHTFFPISFRVYPLRTPIILLWLVDAQLSWSGPKWWTWQSNWSICNSHYSLLSRWTFISFFFFLVNVYLIYITFASDIFSCIFPWLLYVFHKPHWLLTLLWKGALQWNLTTELCPWWWTNSTTDWCLFSLSSLRQCHYVGTPFTDCRWHAHMGIQILNEGKPTSGFNTIPGEMEMETNPFLEQKKKVI